MQEDQDENWLPESNIKTGRNMTGIDEAADLVPDGVRDRLRTRDAFLDSESSVDLEVDSPYTPRTIASAPIMGRSQQEWLDVHDQMDPAMRALISRKTPETIQLLKWQAGLSKNKPSVLVISMLAAKITFSVNVVAFTPVGEFRVFVLPAEAAEIQMEMGAPLSYQYDNKTSNAVFVSCYKLEGFPYKFLQLGVDAEADKE